MSLVYVTGAGMSAKQAWTTLDRKAEMVRAGLTQEGVAAACDCHQTLVGHVIAGRMWTGEKGREVMRYIAAQVKRPVAEVFPFAERRRSA